MLVTDTKDIATHEPLAERLAASNRFPLVGDAVERFAARRVRVTEDQLVPFTDDLCVKSRNGGTIDQNIIRGITPDINDLLRKLECFFPTLRIRAHLKCG